LLQYWHTKEPSLLWASDCRCWWYGKELLHGILWVPTDQNVLKICMLHRNIFPLTGNSK
jgi:hypothetical protein